MRQVLLVVWLAGCARAVPTSSAPLATTSSGTPEPTALFTGPNNFAGTELVACGSSMTGPNASSFRVYVSLLTTIGDNGKGGSTVGVLFESTARDVVGGASNDRVSCGTTGALEQLMLARIHSYLGSSPP